MYLIVIPVFTLLSGPPPRVSISYQREARWACAQTVQPKRAVVPALGIAPTPCVYDTDGRSTSQTHSVCIFKSSEKEIPGEVYRLCEEKKIRVEKRNSIPPGARTHTHIKRWYLLNLLGMLERR